MISIENKLKIDFAIRDPTTNSKIMKGKGDLDETVRDIIKKFNLEKDVIKKKKGSWYDG